MPIYKVLSDVLSVKKEVKLYAITGEVAKLISKHGHVFILEKVRIDFKDGTRIYNSTGVTFSTVESNLKIIHNEH